MDRDYPKYVLNSPQDRPVLRRVFSFHADVYDLDAYEAVSPGLGRAVWDMIECERAHQAKMEQLRAKLNTPKLWPF